MADSRRRSALLALACLTAGLSILIALAIETLPAGLVLLGVGVVAARVARNGVLRQGAARAVRLAIAVGLVVATILALVSEDEWLIAAVGLLLVAAGLSAARRAFRTRADLVVAARPERPVVIWNAKSGGGKAIEHHLADEAAQRGIRAIELGEDDDLAQLVGDAIDSGADALAAAGGDGTLATVAALAAEHGLPFACIPAGTRNHFALDLGVDRDDVVGSLDAFVEGRERVVDLAEVNGRVFVNNVSLGLYAEAVQKRGYRDAKIRTLLETAPEVLGPDSEEDGTLSWTDEDGVERSGASVILVSNNVYRLGQALSTGSRPRLDEGVLGIFVLESPAQGETPMPQWQAWSTPTYEVDSDGRVPAGVDGEATHLEAPVRFTIRPGALRVRIAANHPGASPSASMPASVGETARALVAIAGGSRWPPESGGPRGKSGGPRHG